MLKYYRALKASENFPIEALQELQFFKLQKLCKNFHINIESWNDFHNLPLTTKNQVRSYTPETENHGVSETSGSTGEPFKFATPPERRAINMATELRNWEWLDWTGQLAFRLTRGKPSLKSKLYNGLINVTCKNYRTINESHVKVLGWSPFILHGGTSAVRELTWLAERNHIDCNGTKAILIGEDPSVHIPVLSEYYSAVYQSYGLSECVNVAFECEHHSLHVNMENCIAEEVNGEIVVTNLNNYVTPFIRYRTGDKGHVEKSRCKCGRPHDVITGLQGKSVDFYADETLKRPLGWWLVSPLGHNYSQFFKRYRVEAYPKDGTLRVILVPKLPRKWVNGVMKPYLSWITRETGLDASFVLVEKISDGYKLFEVVT